MSQRRIDKASQGADVTWAVSSSCRLFSSSVSTRRCLVLSSSLFKTSALSSAWVYVHTQTQASIHLLFNSASATQCHFHTISREQKHIWMHTKQRQNADLTHWNICTYVICTICLVNCSQFEHLNHSSWGVVLIIRKGLELVLCLQSHLFMLLSGF